MTRVLHMSDPHFGTERPEVVAALHSLIQTLRPQAVLIGGDVTQRARRGQFQQAARFVSQLGCPTLCIPGNHDIPLYNIVARAFYPYGNYRRWIDRDLDPVFENDTFLVIGVNSTRPSRHKDGEVSAAQIERVRQRLSSAAQHLVKMVMIHHPVRAKVESDRENLLHGRELAVPAWIDAGADFILGGHIHLPYHMQIQGTAPEGRRAWVLQAGTALSHRVRGKVPNSVNVIERHGEQACFAERWDFDASRQCFVMVDRLDAMLSRATTALPVAFVLPENLNIQG